MTKIIVQLKSKFNNLIVLPKEFLNKFIGFSPKAGFVILFICKPYYLTRCLHLQAKPACSSNRSENRGRMQTFSSQPIYHMAGTL